MVDYNITSIFTALMNSAYTVLFPIVASLLMALSAQDKGWVGEIKRVLSLPFNWFVSPLFPKKEAFALLLAGVNLAYSLFLCRHFNFSSPEFQFYWDWSIFTFGLDGISLIFVVLNNFLLLIVILTSLKTENFSNYSSLFFLLTGVLNGAFAALDLVLFYVFFEAVLIPMFFIIGIWGGKHKIYATLKFFLYTLAGSVFFLVFIVYVGSTAGSLKYLELLGMSLPNQKILWWMLFIAFAVKIPMWPLHTWLPDAHVQAPTAGSVMLAGTMIKLGGYGFMRFSLPLLPLASAHYSGLMIILSIVAIIYTSLVAFAQNDIKKLIAYSSVAHMGYVTAGIFSLNEYGLAAAFFQMISHALISGALFLSVGMLYYRTKSLEIKGYSGLVGIVPKFSYFFLFFSMASIGLPGTSGFVGEFLTIMSVFRVSWIYAALVAVGIIGGTIYMLMLCKKIIWGAKCEYVISDLSALETMALSSFVILILALGLAPNFLVKLISPAIENIVIFVR